MAQLFTPNAMDESLGFTGEESAEDFDALPGGEEDAPESEVPLVPGETPDPAVPVAPVAPAAPAQATPEPPAPTPQPSLADVLKVMEAQAARQTQILDRALPQPQPAPQAPRPLPPIPEKYRGILDEETLKGAQVVMEALGITADLEELKQFRQVAAQKENSNSARDLIIGQVPEMKEQAFQDEVAAEMTRTMDAMGVPNELRGQFLNPIFVVQAGNAVKARRSQSAAPAAVPTPDITQALASRAGGETQTSAVAGSVSDSSQQPVDYMEMSDEDFAKAQAKILRKQNGSW